MKRLHLLWLLVVAGIFLIAGLERAFAETVYANLGPLSLPIPWDSVNAVYLYNETAKVNQIGGEMVFARLKVGSYKNNPVELNITGGGVLTPNTQALGTGFAGLNIYLPNPIPGFTTLGIIQPGLFGGYSIRDHQWQFGLKAALNIFNG